VPNNASLGFSMYGPAWPMTDLPRHLSFFTDGSLRAILAVVGFEVERVCYTGYCRQFVAAWIECESQIWEVIDKRAPPNFRRLALAHFCAACSRRNRANTTRSASLRGTHSSAPCTERSSWSAEAGCDQVGW
jgi:hypothetical protein